MSRENPLWGAVVRRKSAQPQRVVIVGVFERVSLDVHEVVG
jgi:hypothetical protein